DLKCSLRSAVAPARSGHLRHSLQELTERDIGLLALSLRRLTVVSLFLEAPLCRRPHPLAVLLFLCDLGLYGVELLCRSLVLAREGVDLFGQRLVLRVSAERLTLCAELAPDAVSLLAQVGF